METNQSKKICLLFSFKSKYRSGYYTKRIFFNNEEHLQNWKNKWWDTYQVDYVEVTRYDGQGKEIISNEL